MRNYKEIRTIPSTKADRLDELGCALIGEIESNIYSENDPENDPENDSENDSENDPENDSENETDADSLMIRGAALGVDLTTYRDYEGCTPVYLGASHGKHKIVRLLVSLGADPNTQDKKWDATPLHANFNVAILSLREYRNEKKYLAHYTGGSQFELTALTLLDFGAYFKHPPSLYLQDSRKRGFVLDLSYLEGAIELGWGKVVRRLMKWPNDWVVVDRMGYNYLLKEGKKDLIKLLKKACKNQSETVINALLAPPYGEQYQTAELYAARELCPDLFDRCYEKTLLSLWERPLGEMLSLIVLACRAIEPGTIDTKIDVVPRELFIRSLEYQILAYPGKINATQALMYALKKDTEMRNDISILSMLLRLWQEGFEIHLDEPSSEAYLYKGMPRIRTAICSGLNKACAMKNTNAVNLLIEQGALNIACNDEDAAVVDAVLACNASELPALSAGDYGRFFQERRSLREEPLRNALPCLRDLSR